MKKFFPILLVCSTAQLAHAQSPIKAGTVALSGSINYAHTGEETSSNSSSGSYTSSYSNNTLALSPTVSYFIADNLAVGVDLNYSIQEVSYKYSGSSTTSYRDYSSLRVGPFVQYYKMLNDQFGFTGRLGAGYEHDNQPPSNNSTPTTTTLKANGFYAALTPGIIFLPIPKLGIGASIGGLGYSRLSIKSDGNYDYSDVLSTFGANFGLAQLTFSGTYFFGR